MGNYPIVQKLCAKGKITGTILFCNTCVIPKDEVKLKDWKYKKISLKNRKTEIKDMWNLLIL